MTDTATEFQSLLRLLDDDHPTVRDAVKRKLASYGAGLDDLLREASPETIRQVQRLHREWEQDVFLEGWTQWLEEKDHPGKLEDGLVLIASFLSPSEDHPVTVSEDLDDLAREFTRQYPQPDFRDLAEHLFGSGLFRGNEGNYYSPQNSNLAHILQSREGNQIGLACVGILVGQRVDLPIEGCNYPTHFLARCVDPFTGELYLIDCFNEGQIIDAESLIRHHPLASTGVEDVVNEAAPAEIIIARVLRNLDQAYARLGETGEQQFVRDLWQAIADSGV